MKKREVRVVVTCGGGFQGMTLLKALSFLDSVEVDIFDSNDNNLTSYFFGPTIKSTTIKEGADKYIEQLLRHCTIERAQFVIPATAIDLELLAENKQRFLAIAGCRVMVPDKVKTLQNKVHAHQFFRNHGFPVQDLIDPARQLVTYPLLAKPNHGWGGKDLHVIKDEKQLSELDEKQFHFVKWFSDFREYSIDFSTNWEGRVGVPLIRKRTVTTGGFSVVSEVLPIEHDYYLEFLPIIEKAFSGSEMSGIYNLQFLENEGKIYFSDLNPRIGTSAVINQHRSAQLVGHIIEEGGFVLPSIKAPTLVLRSLKDTELPVRAPSNIEAVVFDLDDTLISNRSYVASRCEKLFDTGLFDLGEKQAFLAFVLSICNEGQIARLIDLIAQRFSLEDSHAHLLSLYREQIPEELTVYEDVTRTLRWLKINGYRIYVLTDNPIQSQKNKLAIFPDSDLLDGVFFSRSLGVDKPNPKAFNQISQAHDIPAENLLMVGDNEYRDVLGSLEAGYGFACHIIRSNGLVTDSIRDMISPQLLIERSAKIESLHQLKQLLRCQKRK